LQKIRASSIFVELKDCLCENKNLYNLPIDLTKVTKVATEGIAHVGDLEHSIDYDAPEGTPVLAALNGVVIAVKDDSNTGGTDQKYENDGNYIEILHDNSEVSEYEHILFRSSKVKAGDNIRAGQTIAQVGNTGWSECPHLHLWFIQRGKNIKLWKLGLYERYKK
jgi:murein DD-endopeptidase MepM/ murein hydrolase activator NlpD